VTRVPNNWRPRDYQMPLWRYLAGGGKRALAVWHRRSGKDEVCLHRVAVAAIKRPATYWHMLPEYAQGRKAIWNAVNPHTGKRRIDEAFPPSMVASRNDHEMFIRFTNGATWQVVGSDRYDAAVGSSLGGIVFSEWALSNPAAWAYLAPILVESGGFAIFITTSRGRNHAKTMLDMARGRDDWFTQTLTVDDTDVLTKAQIEEQRAEYHGIFGEEAGDSLIEQEYYCSFEAAVLGAYFGREMREAEQRGRICDVPINTDLPVHTAWDIGVSDAMSIWCFQVYPDHIDVVDYIENNGKGFDFYCKMLDDRGYHGVDWVPHDAKVREAGAPDARTRIETMILLGRKPELVPDQKLMDGINAARKTIPFARFDQKKTAKGLECLREYKTEWDEKGRVFKKTPAHTWASHGADAWRYLSIAWRAPTRPDDVAPHVDFKPLPELTYDELLDIEDSPTREQRA
jgi:phage terminase large subunit